MEHILSKINKHQAYESLKATLNLCDEEFACISDDIVDLPIMQQVGCSITAANAVSQVKTCADWTTHAAGGRGGMREACDFILATQNKADQALQGYLYGDRR